MKFGIALREVPDVTGLTRSDINDLFDMLNSEEAYPIELEAKQHECSAMGFITPFAADKLNYDYEKSGLHDFIANILDDMNNESESCQYQFNDIQIWLSR